MGDKSLLTSHFGGTRLFTLSNVNSSLCNLQQRPARGQVFVFGGLPEDGNNQMQSMMDAKAGVKHRALV